MPTVAANTTKFSAWDPDPIHDPITGFKMPTDN